MGSARNTILLNAQKAHTTEPSCFANKKTRHRLDSNQSERAARKAMILPMATMYMVFGGTLLNLGLTLNGQGSHAMANGLFVGAGAFFALFMRSMQRVKRLHKFEKMI